MDLGSMGDMQQYLQGVIFPANKEEVASGAESIGAPQDFVDQIRKRRHRALQRPRGCSASDIGLLRIQEGMPEGLLGPGLSTRAPARLVRRGLQV